MFHIAKATQLMFKEGLAYIQHNHHDELFTLLEANDYLRLCHLLNQATYSGSGEVACLHFRLQH